MPDQLEREDNHCKNFGFARLVRESNYQQENCISEALLTKYFNH